MPNTGFRILLKTMPKSNFKAFNIYTLLRLIYQDECQLIGPYRAVAGASGQGTFDLTGFHWSDSVAIDRTLDNYVIRDT